MKTLAEKLTSIFPALAPADEEQGQEIRKDPPASYKIPPQIWMLFCLVVGYVILWFLVEGE